MKKGIRRTTVDVTNVVSTINTVRLSVSSHNLQQSTVADGCSLKPDVQGDPWLQTAENPDRRLHRGMIEL